MTDRAQLGDWVAIAFGPSLSIGVVKAIGADELCVDVHGTVQLVPVSQVREIRRAAPAKKK